MGIVARQSFWNSLNSYLGVALGALNTMILFPYVFLNEADFTGEIQTVLAFATVVSTFGHLGFPLTITTYFPRLKEKEQGQLWSLAILLVSLAFIGLLGIGMLLAYGFGYAQNNIFYALIIILGMLSFELFAALAQHHKSVVFPQFLKHVFRRLLVSVAILASYFSWIGYDGFYLILSVGYLFQIALVAYYCRGFLPKSWKPFSFKEGKSYLQYGLMVMLASGAMVLVSRIDMLMIRGLMGKPEVAFYSIALFIGTVVSVPSKALLVSLRPFISRAWADGKLEEIQNLYRRSASTQLVVSSFLFLGIWVSLPIAWLIVPEQYQFAEANWVVLAIACGEIIQGATGANGMILTISDRQRFNFYSGLGLLVITVITNFLLIPQLGLLGAAIASLIAMTLFNFIKLWILGKELKIWPFSALFLKVIPVLFVCFGLIYIIQSANLGLALEIMLGLVLIGLSFLILYRYSTALDDFKAILNRKSA